MYGYVLTMTDKDGKKLYGIRRYWQIVGFTDKPTIGQCHCSSKNQARRIKRNSSIYHSVKIEPYTFD